MIINIRNEINKSFFLIISSLLSIRNEASTQQLVFPIDNISICGIVIQYIAINNWKIIDSMLWCICQGNLNIIKKETFSSFMLNVYLKNGRHLRYYFCNILKCHFFITNISNDKRNKMSEEYFRIFIINVLLLIISPPFSRKEVDTQQLNISLQ